MYYFFLQFELQRDLEILLSFGFFFTSLSAKLYCYPTKQLISKTHSASLELRPLVENNPNPNIKTNGKLYSIQDTRTFQNAFLFFFEKSDLFYIKKK